MILWWIIYEAEVAVVGCAGCRGVVCCKWVGGNTCVNWGLAVWGLGSPSLGFPCGVNTSAQPRACTQPLMSCLLLSLQFPSTPSRRCVRGSSRRSSSAMPTAASTPTAASASTTGTTWNLWTWCPPALRKHAPGSQGWSTWWQGSVTRTASPNAKGPETNILPVLPGSVSQQRRAMDKLRIPYSICFATSEH